MIPSRGNMIVAVPHDTLSRGNMIVAVPHDTVSWQHDSSSAS
jgi:hypothetical protein